MGVSVACKHTCPPFSLYEWLPTDGETAEGSASTLLFLATSHHSLQGNYPTNIPDNLKVLQEKASLVELSVEHTKHKFGLGQNYDLFTLNPYDS